MGVLSETTLSKCEKTIEVNGNPFTEALMGEVEMPTPEIDERIDVKVNGDEVTINDRPVENYTKEEFAGMKEEAKQLSGENYKSETYNLQDILKNAKERKFSGIGEERIYAFIKDFGKIEKFYDFFRLEKGEDMEIKIHNDIMVEIGNSCYGLYKIIGYEDVSSEFDSNREILSYYGDYDNFVEAVWDYIDAGHQDMSFSEAAHSLIECEAMQHFGIFEIYDRAKDYIDAGHQDVTIEEAVHSVVCNDIMDRTGLSEVLNEAHEIMKSDNYSGNYSDAFNEALDKCSQHSDMSQNDFKDYMKELFNNIDDLADNYIETLWDAKEQIVNTWNEDFEFINPKNKRYSEVQI